jgi:hypothetical protein
MGRPTWGSDYWPWFLLGAGLAFLIPEVIAFFTNSANTLSDFSWYELGISGRINHHTVYWWVSLAAWWVFVGVISAHIWFRTPG